KRLALDLSPDAKNTGAQGRPTARRAGEPGLLEQALVGDDHAGATGEMGDKGELRRGELNRLAVDREFSAEQVEGKRTVAVEARPPGRGEALKLGHPHARGEIRGAERAGKIVGAHFERGDAVRLAGLRAERNDRGARVRALRGRERVAIDRVEVEDDDVRLAGPGGRVRLERAG